ncbi:orotidine 5'-phosphate decarboxylase [Planctomycetales bacterium]|nr:orotidine 5'-phosphate decarboxylase [Planctomycetales bacterium]
MTFSQTLLQTIQTKKTPVLVGLDPRYESLPAVFKSVFGSDTAALDASVAASAYKEFCCAVIDIVASLVPAVKPQSAFFEQFGPFGMTALESVIRYARKKGLLVIFDGKRNDIGSTAAAYAAGILGKHSAWGADALTVSPYLGDDSIEPFVKTATNCNAGVFVLVKTSNPGGAMIQDLLIRDLKSEEYETIYRRIARYVNGLSLNTIQEKEKYGSVGAVVGATWAEQLAELRTVMPNSWFLVPGYGSQGGSAKSVAAAFDDNGLGAVINNSRGILFSYQKEPYRSRFGEPQWEKAVEAATLDMIAELRSETTAGRL